MSDPKILRERPKQSDEVTKRNKKTVFLRALVHKMGNYKYLLLVMALFIAGEIYVTERLGGKGSLIRYFLSYTIHVLFFLMYCFVIMPFSKRTRKTIWKPALAIALSLSAHFLLLQTANWILIYPYKFRDMFVEKQNVELAYRVCYVFGVSLLYWRHLEKLKAMREKAILENSILHYRLNPHLIFNALNHVHAKVQKVSASGGDMVALLADYARYSLQPVDPDGKRPLATEIDQLRCLIGINRLRFGTIYLNLDTRISDPGNELRILPNIIMTLAENLFKHGDLETENYPAVIRIQNQENQLDIYMSNKIAHAENKISHNIGLDNLTARLKNSYGNNYTIKIKTTPEWYSTELTITL